MKLPTDIVNDLNKLSVEGNILSPGLGDILQYMASSLGDGETIRPSAEPDSNPVSRGNISSYKPDVLQRNHVGIAGGDGIW